MRPLSLLGFRLTILHFASDHTRNIKEFTSSSSICLLLCHGHRTPLISKAAALGALLSMHKQNPPPTTQKDMDNINVALKKWRDNVEGQQTCFPGDIV